MIRPRCCCVGCRRCKLLRSSCCWRRRRLERQLDMAACCCWCHSSLYHAVNHCGWVVREEEAELENFRDLCFLIKHKVPPQSCTPGLLFIPREWILSSPTMTEQTHPLHTERHQEEGGRRHTTHPSLHAEKDTLR
jgi:hypothetical protein